eukprot:symbB.v1.2.018202.t1/scaffold1209.1/size131499/3
MIMLLLRRCFVAAHGGSEAKNPKDLEAVELEDVKPQLVLQVGFIIFISISKFFVNYAPWLCEASCAVLILHLLWIMVTPQSSPPPTTIEAPAKAKTKPSAPRDHDSVAVPAAPPAAEKVGPKAVEPKGKKPGGVLDVSLWADLEEEDEFQEVLAAKLQSEAVPSAASKAAPPVAPKEEAGSADVIEDEVPRPKRKAKAKKVREGANVRKEETPNPWAARIRSCGKAKDLEGALQAVEEALSSGVSSRQHQEIQNALLHALIQCGDAAGETATELFNQLKAEKKADVVTFNIMLRSLLCAGKRDEAQSLLKDMREHGLSANKVTITELLSDRTRANDTEGVWRIVDWMQSTDFGITNAACSILLKRITAESPGDEVDRTFALIQRLSEPLDEALCSQAVEAAIRTSRPQLANNFMETLGTLRSKTKTSGSAATFGSMIKLHGQNSDLQQVWSTWKLMHEKGIHPSSVTLGCMVEALVNCSVVEEAAKLVRETASTGDSSILNTVIYSSIIKGFAQGKQAEKCFRTLEEMEAHGIPGNTITYNTLLDACAKCGTMARVPAIFEKMKQCDVEPDRITYSTLIKGYCVAGELDCAFKLFEELKADGKLDLDEIVYNSLLDGCSRKQKPQKAMEYLNDMISVGIQPSNYTLSIMVKLLGRAKRLNEALKLAEDYRKEFNLKLNVQVFTCLMQACLLNKKVQKALDIYKEMIGELGRMPDRKAHTVLVDGCLNAGAFDEAVQVCRCAYGFGAPELQVRAGITVGVEAKVLSDLANKVALGRVGSVDEALEVLDAADPSGKLRAKASTQRERPGAGSTEEGWKVKEAKPQRKNESEEKWDWDASSWSWNSWDDKNRSWKGTGEWTRKSRR